MIGMGQVSKTLGNTLYGLNNQPQIGEALSANQLQQGMAFFTRPQLNLTSKNIRNSRELLNLITNKKESISRYIRCSLDPRLAKLGEITGEVTLDGAGKPTKNYTKISTPLVQENQAFIPVLSNRLTTLTGWPDRVFPSFTSEEGLYKQVYSQIDGSARIYGKVELNATFADLQGSPILRMMDIWGLYSTLVFEGIIAPYPDFWVEDEIDYNVRIFRILLNTSGNKVAMIASSGPGFIDSIGIGSTFDFNRSAQILDQGEDVTVKFAVHGITYNDPVLLLEFNQTVEIHQPGMKDANRDQEMEKINPNVLRYFNYAGYPRINLNTLEFEHWIEIEKAKEIKERFLEFTDGKLTYNNYQEENTVEGDGIYTGRPIYSGDI